LFRRDSGPLTQDADTPPQRVTSVLGTGINWKGNLRGSGGIRIEGAFEGEITIQGMVVVGETGRVTTDSLRANSVVVAGTVRGNIVAERLEIRSTGRVWGDATIVNLSTEDGAFLRGKVQMEDQVDITLGTAEDMPGSEESLEPDEH